MADETLESIGYDPGIVSLDYTARDYPAVLAELVRRAQQVIPEWTARGEGDFVMMIAEIVAAGVDLANYYIDRVLSESTLATATSREQILALAEQLGYITHGSIPSKATVTVRTDVNGPPVTIAAGTQFISDYVPEIDGPVVFEADEDVLVPGNGGTAEVPVTQGQTVQPYLAGHGSGQPGFQLLLPHQGVIEGSVRVWVQGPHANVEWTRVNRLVQAAPGEQVFEVRLRADGTTVVRFGTGANGAIPDLGAEIYLSYRVGVGKYGNLPAGKIRHIALPSQQSGVVVAVDSSNQPLSTAATGGADPETNTEIRRNAPQAFAAQNRCVTLEDFERLALQVPGVSAANAVSARTASVTVYVAGPDRTIPNQSLLEAVQAHLAAHAVAGVMVSANAPQQVPVNFGTEQDPLRVYVAPGWRDVQVAETVRTELANIFKSEDVTLGSRITLSTVYTRLSQLPGVINVSIPVMARADAPQSGADDAVMEPHELPVLGSVELITVGGVITPV